MKKTFADHVLGYWGYSRITGAVATTNDAFRYGDSADVALGSKQWDRTLSSYNVQKLNKDCWIAFRTNPIFSSVVEMVVSMIVGNTARPVVNNMKDKTGPDLRAAELLQAALDSHWNSPQNDWKNTLPDVSRDFLLFGEVIPVPAIDRMTGDVFWGFVAPESIKRMVRDPLNARRVIALVVAGETGEEIELPIVDTDLAGTSRMGPLSQIYETAQNSTAGRMTGRCMYWAINRALTSARGTGDFVQAIRPTRDTVKLVSSIAERARINNKTVADIKFPASWTQAQINDALKPGSQNYINPPRVDNDDPALFGHSDGVEFKFITPQIGASENNEVFTMLKAMVCVAAHNAPEHLVFGQGVNSNRATAAEMGAPFYEYLNMRQNSISGYVTNAVNFAIDQKAIFTNELAGMTPEQLRDWTLELPQVNIENVLEQLDATLKRAQILESAKLTGGVDQEQAAAASRDLLGQAGLRVPISQGE